MNRSRSANIKRSILQKGKDWKFEFRQELSRELYFKVRLMKGFGTMKKAMKLQLDTLTRGAKKGRSPLPTIRPRTATPLSPHRKWVKKSRRTHSKVQSRKFKPKVKYITDIPQVGTSLAAPTDSVMAHAEQEHGMTNERKVACYFLGCNEWFKSKYLVQKHVEQVHVIHQLKVIEAAVQRQVYETELARLGIPMMISNALMICYDAERGSEHHYGILQTEMEMEIEVSPMDVDVDLYVGGMDADVEPMDVDVEEETSDEETDEGDTDEEETTS